MPRGSDQLGTYRAKRQFDRTPEPQGGKATRAGNLYAIQKHAATRLHYDLRLELDGVLKSWAITRGPSLDPAQKRLAVRTEDHPVDYGDFEGTIPSGNYGAGTVLLWDQGTWEPIKDARRGLKDGRLEFVLHGERLKGRWALIRMRNRGSEKRENWLLIKGDDDEARREVEITEAALESVATGRTLKAIAENPERRRKPGKANDTPQRRNAASRAGSSPLPGFVKPALATLVEDVPEGDDWLFEIKFDGYRAIAAASGDEVRIYTRNGLDWTSKYPAIAQALASLNLDGALLDGEIVVVDKEGKSDFGALQAQLKGGGGSLSFFVFDVLALGGESLRSKPLVERKDMLRKLLGKVGKTGPVFYTDHVEGNGQAMLGALCGRGFEGVIAKRSRAKYVSGRGHAWLKIKCGASQEFVIVGWSPSDRNRPFSSILLAVNEGGVLRYAGRVGSGFSHAALDDLSSRFRRLSRKTRPVDGPVPADVARKARWLQPKLVANIAFAEFTRDGLVRHGRFLGLREDKPAQAVIREQPEKGRD
ncbi:non-homologous end-joining DNA ligase [Emcibacter sp. SYSU 3D8]|uniref:non-homologous end-joining DNA ligase n=1 Tax=Emcibacter sp. SYSU 3D8 TaxID=3133969 RepID=UPI0031FE9309